MTTAAQIEVLCDVHCNRVVFCSDKHIILEANTTQDAERAAARLNELDIAAKAVPVFEGGVAYVNVWF